MKIKVYFSLIAALVAFTANAQNVISNSGINITAGGTAAVTIELNNSDELRGLQFDLMLPEGLSLATWEDEDEPGTFYPDINYTNRTQTRTKTFEFSVSQKEGAIRFIGFTGMTTSTSKTITSGEGAVLEVTMNSTVNYNGPLYFNNVSISDYNNQKQPIKFPICKLGTTGYASYSSLYNNEIEGAKAYYGTINQETETITLSEVEGAVYPEHGVILKGDKEATVYGISVESAVEPTNNDLKGSVSGKDVTGLNTLVLSNGSKGIGFYSFTGSFIPAGKAYIEYSAPSSAPLRILFEDATGIEDLENENSIETDSYDLFGNKVKNESNRIVIENGKKTIHL